MKIILLIITCLGLSACVLAPAPSPDQELIVRKQQEQIDDLTKRIEKLEKKKTAFEPRSNQEFTPYDHDDVIIAPYLKNTLENRKSYIYKKTKPLPLGQD